ILLLILLYSLSILHVEFLLRLSRPIRPIYFSIYPNCFIIRRQAQAISESVHQGEGAGLDEHFKRSLARELSSQLLVVLVGYRGRLSGQLSCKKNRNLLAQSQCFVTFP